MSALRHIVLCAPLWLAAWTARAQSWVPVDTAEVAAAHARSCALQEGRTSYRMVVRVASWRDAGDPTAAEEAVCIIRRSGKLYKAEHFGLVSYQDGEFRVMVDPEERAVMLSDGQPVYELLGARLQRELFAHIAKAEKSATAAGTSYRIHLGRPWEWDQVILEFGRDGWMKRVEMRWAGTMEADPGNPLTALVTPKLAFWFEAPAPLDVAPAQLHWNTVLRLNGTEALALGPCTGYSVVDMRPR